MTVAVIAMADIKGVHASVGPGVNALPVFAPAEHDLDLVVLAIECDIVRRGDLAIALCWDAGGYATCGEGTPN